MPAGRRRSMADLLDQQRAIEKPLDSTASPRSASAAITADSLPAPYLTADGGPLGSRERADLTTCEAALDNLRVAFWAAGKALQVIRDARLYRDSHGTFEAYVEDRWDMSRPQAYRLIEAWPLAECLSPIGDTLNESQIRELLPLAGRHGQDAAVTVYRTIAETDGVHVTASLLHRVVGVLPADHFDPASAVDQIRAFLAGTIASAPAADPVETFTTQAARLLRVLHRVSAGGVLQAAMDADPDVVRKVITDMRTLLDQIEHDTQTASSLSRSRIGGLSPA
jgi:hypothetical protein